MSKVIAAQMKGDNGRYSTFDSAQTQAEIVRRMNLLRVQHPGRSFRLVQAVQEESGIKILRDGRGRPLPFQVDLHPDANYNYEKDTCDVCGITKAEAKKHPVDTGINHPEYRYSTSFYLSNTGSVTCARCHREAEIASAIAAIDRYEARKADRVS